MRLKSTLAACLPRRSTLEAVRPVFLGLALMAASAGAQAPADVRVALVIGNSAYADSPLLNPANDAKAMSAALTGLGFKVVELRDGSKDEMARAIAQVSELLKNKRGVGMFYYAGHGLQLDWRNYMVPVDAQVRSPQDVVRQTVDVSSIIEAYKQAGNRMNIVVLDACRNNPFSSSATGKGLAPLDAPSGTFLAYATAPGSEADDGDSGNGLYTRFLLDELGKPTARIEDVFKRVRLQVRQKSAGRQIPWESTSLEEDFYFNTGQKIVKPDENARRAAFDQEKADWAKIKDTQDAADLFAFLQKYPRSELSEMAQYRLDRIAKPVVRPILGQGQSASLAYTGDRLRLGDEYGFVIKDSLTGVLVRNERAVVTKSGPDQVELNGGGMVVTPLSGIVKNNFGTHEPPFASAPAEFSLGKSWEGQSLRTLPDGRQERMTINSRITGRETISVPGGKFETWVIESTAFIQPLYNAPALTNRIKSWIDPRYGVPVQRSESVRNFHGVIVRSEMRQLASLKAPRD